MPTPPRRAVAARHRQGRDHVRGRPAPTGDRRRCRRAGRRRRRGDVGQLALRATSYVELRTCRSARSTSRHWAADGALAIFFFVAGLEVKREFLVGSLRKPADALVPIAAALAGVAVPALVYTAVNLGNGTPMAGPSRRPPTSRSRSRYLRSSGRRFPAAPGVPPHPRGRRRPGRDHDHCSLLHLTLCTRPAGRRGRPARPLCVLAAAQGDPFLVYVPLVLACWWFVHESGIHATIAGVALGLLTRVLPDSDEPAPRRSGSSTG